MINAETDRVNTEAANLCAVVESTSNTGEKNMAVLRMTRIPVDVATLAQP